MQRAARNMHAAEGMLHQLSWYMLLALLSRVFPRLKAARHKQKRATVVRIDPVVLEADMGSKLWELILLLLLQAQKKSFVSR